MADNNLNQPFSFLLKEALGDYRGATRLLSESISDRGKNVSMRMIQKYKSGESIPPLSTALLISDVLEMNLTREEIEASLEIGERQRPVIEKSLKSTKIRNVNILLSNVAIDGLPEEMVESLIDDRVFDLFGDDKNALSRYLEFLITNDLLSNQ